MWQYRYTPELRHYGVKGMKWGVRRTREELRYNRYSTAGIVNRALKTNPIRTRAGFAVTDISLHASEQAESRRITAREILDALQAPLYTEKVRTDSKNRRSVRFVGYAATVNVNPDSGVIVTVWKTGKDKRGGK